MCVVGRGECVPTKLSTFSAAGTSNGWLDVRLSKKGASAEEALLSLLLRDLGHAWRLLRRQPAFTGVAILTLALGIGATTAVFTIVNGVLLRPLPYRDPSRLVTLFYGHQGRVSPWFSPLNMRDYVGPSESFAEASAVAPITVNMTGLGDPERLQGARVSWNYFRLLGVSMALGRPFAEGDAQSDGSRSSSRTACGDVDSAVAWTS
jgi:hypothetical protein